MITGFSGKITGFNDEIATDCCCKASYFGDNTATLIAYLAFTGEL